jgi:FemAB-related protein (PEP-CTERM system-associated)
MSEITVALLKPADEAAWDRFVQRSPSGTFFHLSGWRNVIESAFGHRTFYLAAFSGNDIAGVLPLTFINSRIFGRSLISNAFCVAGGPLADDSAGEQALIDHATKIGRDLNVDCIEMRCPTAQPGWVSREGLYVDFRRAIDPDAEANLKAIPRKQRAMIRKGIAGGLVSEIDDNVERLHEVYAQSVHRLGTPVFSKRYFEILKKEFGEACDVVTIVSGRKPVASVMNFYFRDEVLPYYGGGTGEARALAGNDFMYWEVMRRACERGYRVFDFGRSKIGTGAYNFKRYWGFEPAPLAYQFLPIGKAEIPDNNPLSPKFRLMVSTWQKLPLFATKIVGPMIVRSIG